jgi:hypothetical protein
VENSKLITSGTKTNVIQIYEKSTLQLTKSTIEAKDGSSSGIYFAKENGGASVANATITESTIIASSYAISSNASPGEDGQAITRYIKLDVSKSTLKSIGAAGVLLNVPITKVDDVKFDDCNIYGASQAVVIRGGKATITNCRLGILYDVEALNSSYPEGCKDSDDKYYNWSQDTADKNVVLYSSESYDTRKTWGDGNNVYRAVLVLGDDGTSTAYAYDTEVVIDGVTFTTKVQLNADTEGESKYTTAIYALGKEANKVTLTINGENNFGDLSIIAANGYVTVVKNSSATVTYYVATAEELFAASSKADGDIVILMNDIDLNDSLTLSDDE